MRSRWDLVLYRLSAGSLARRQRQLLRFLAVGILNTVFGYSAFAGLFILTNQRDGSLIVATILGILFNFFTTGRIVFGNKTWRTLLPFILAYGVALGLNLMALNVLVRLGVGTLIAEAISLPLVVVVSYLINARFVFRARPPRNLSPEGRDQ